MQLSPQEYFTIARGLEDHTDNTVFYVRASIRNARTDVLIDTVDLTNQGDNHRYSLPWLVPADPSGQGFYILITTSVYTDSGYTTKSDAYADEYDTYLVMNRVNPNSGMGGGVDIDYKRIQKMIDAAIAKIPQPEKVEMPQIPDLDLSKVLSALTSVQKSVGGIVFPEQKEVDLSQVLAKLDEVIDIAGNRDVMADHVQPLHDMHDKLSEMMDSKQGQFDETTSKAHDALARIQTFFTDDVEKIMGGIEELKKKLTAIDALVLIKKSEEEA